LGLKAISNTTLLSAGFSTDFFNAVSWVFIMSSHVAAGANMVNARMGQYQARLRQGGNLRRRTLDGAKGVTDPVGLAFTLAHEVGEAFILGFISPKRHIDTRLPTAGVAGFARSGVQIQLREINALNRVG
jgi:hypothetical protein